MCNYLLANYLWSLHVYRNSNYEKKPLGNPGLIHNALPSYALLKFAALRRRRGEEWRRYYTVAKDNVDNFILSLWDESLRAFKGWPNQESHIHNMNMAAVMALTALFELGGEEYYLTRFVKPAVEFTLRCQVETGPFAGAYPYADRIRDYIAIYTLITAYGLLEYYKLTHEERILFSVKDAIQGLADKIDSNSGFMSHYYAIKYPEWVLDTLFFLNVTKRLERAGVRIPINKDGILRKALACQYDTGGFPLSIGFARRALTKSRPEPQVRKLRDVMAVPSWNSWNFWLLSEFLPATSLPSDPSTSFPFVLKTGLDDGHVYRLHEDFNSLSVFEEPTQRPVLLLNKRDDVAQYCALREYDLASTLLTKVEALPPIIRRPLYLAFSRL